MELSVAVNCLILVLESLEEAQVNAPVLPTTTTTPKLTFPNSFQSKANTTNVYQPKWNPTGSLVLHLLG